MNKRLSRLCLGEHKKHKTFSVLVNIKGIKSSILVNNGRKTLSVLVNIGILSPKFWALCVLNSLSPSPVTKLLLRVNFVLVLVFAYIYVYLYTQYMYTNIDKGKPLSPSPVTKLLLRIIVFVNHVKSNSLGFPKK